VIHFDRRFPWKVLLKHALRNQGAAACLFATQRILRTNEMLSCAGTHGSYFFMVISIQHRAMHKKIEYSEDKRVVVVKQEGKVRYSTVMEDLPQIARLMEKHHTHLAAVDLRAAEVQLSVPEVYFVTKQLADQGILPGSRMAFICPRSEENGELYDFCALAARNRGYRTRLFEAMEDAEGWLQEGRTHEADEAVEKT